MGGDPSGVEVARVRDVGDARPAPVDTGVVRVGEHDDGAAGGLRLAYLDALRGVEGVASVDAQLTHQLPPPDAPVP